MDLPYDVWKAGILLRRQGAKYRKPDAHALHAWFVAELSSQETLETIQAAFLRPKVRRRVRSAPYRRPRPERCDAVA